MDVSIILVNYNTKELLRNCLNSIFEKTRDIEFEVFVVDNASSDASCEVVEKEFQQVKLIKNTENLGFGKANNIAIRQSSAKYVFLLNSDTILINNAVKTFFDFMEKDENKRVAACAGDLFDERMNKQTSFGNFPSLTEIFFRLGLKYLFREYYENNLTLIRKNNSDLPHEIDYASGADLFLRKSVIDKVGAFDENFFMYYEDSDLCFRIKKAGYSIKILPDAKIIHLESKSSVIHLKRELISKKSEIYFFRKYKSNFEVFVIKALYSIIYFIAIFVRKDSKYLTLLTETVLM